MGNPLNPLEPVPEEAWTIKLNREIIYVSYFRFKEIRYIEIKSGECCLTKPDNWSQLWITVMAQTEVQNVKKTESGCSNKIYQMQICTERGEPS